MWRSLVTLAFVVFDLLCGSLAQQQHYLPLHAQKPQIITRELRQYIDGLLEEGRIPGLSLGVVHPGGVVEVEGFGRRSEDGARTTPEVRHHNHSPRVCFRSNASVSLDIVQYCILLESIHSQCIRHPYG